MSIVFSGVNICGVTATGVGKIVAIPSGTTYTTPVDWFAPWTIEVIGAGGGGGAPRAAVVVAMVHRALLCLHTFQAPKWI
jgi:hypothetical protein